jgi:hypothetical protein
MYEAGHGVANHSWSHTSFRGLGLQSFRWEITSTSEAISAYESKCIRPPYGHTDANTANFAQELGYTLALWNVDPQDWRLPGAAVIANRILANVQPQSVILLHDGGGDRSQTVAALRTVLERLTADGYVFKAVCRDAPMPDVYGTPKPDNAPAGDPGAPASPIPGIPTSVPPDLLAQSAGDGGKVLAQELPPPNTQGAILLPAVGATVKGVQPIIGSAASPTFVKWQLDLLINGSEELFLALGEAPQPGPGPLFAWDTTLYPNGTHMLRLRVVYEGSNYDEYFTHVVVANE